MTARVTRVAPTAAGCGRCEGVGLYYDRQVQVGRYGQLRLCPCVTAVCRCGGQPPFRYWDEAQHQQWCPCAGYRRRLWEANRLFAQAEIPERYRWKFLDDFHRQAGDGTAVPFADQVLVQVGDLLGSSEEPRRGFLFHGCAGSGKTLLGCIILNELMVRWGKPARFLNLSRKYFERLRDTYSAESAHYGQTWQIMEELCSLPFLMLDDFGTQRGTDWEMEMLYNLVDARYGDERFTLITTNRPLSELGELSQGRIHSRLTEMCRFVGMDGLDFRRHMPA
ncbi:MAG: ATP-binding protein [Candidatus Latescibacterota bacterium]